MKRGFIKAIAAIFGLTALVGNTPAGMSSNKTTGQTDILNTMPGQRGITIEKQLSKTPENPYKTSKVPFKNQKQYRKWLRSNPHMRATKKNKLNQKKRNK